MNYLKTIIVLFVLCMCGCATYGEKKYSEYMSQAKTSLQNKEYYDAVTSALTSLRYDTQQEAKDLVISNSGNAINQMSVKISMLPYDVESFKKAKDIDEKTSDISKEVKGYKTLQTDDSDLTKFKTYYDAYLNKMYDDIAVKVDASIAKNDADTAINDLSAYLKADIPKTVKITNSVSKLIDYLITTNNIEKLTDLLENNAKFVNADKLVEVSASVNKLAAKLEMSGDKKKALVVYEKAYKLSEANTDASNAIARIKNEIMTTFSIADILNVSDESVSFSYSNMLSIIEPELIKKDKYIEFVQANKYLPEDSITDAEFDNILQSKQVRFKVSKNIRYVISPKITAIKINRSSPIIMTKTASWDYGADGSAFLIGAQESLNYGGNVNHYEYTESTERVTSSQKLEFLVFDTKTKRIVMKDRIDSRYEDSSTWAENPMAVGRINKTPASYYPSKIRSLMSNRHSAASDDEIKSKMLNNAFEQMAKKITEKLFIETVN